MSNANHNLTKEGQSKGGQNPHKNGHDKHSRKEKSQSHALTKEEQSKEGKTSHK